MDDPEADASQSDGSMKSQASVLSMSRPDQRNGSDSQENLATQIAPTQSANLSDSIPARQQRCVAPGKYLLGVLGQPSRSTSNTQVHTETPLQKPLPTSEPQNATEKCAPNTTPKQTTSQSLPLESNKSASKEDRNKPGEQTQSSTQKAPINLSQLSSRDYAGNTCSIGSSRPANGNHANNTRLSQTEQGQKRKIDRSPQGSQTVSRKEAGRSPRKRRKHLHLPLNAESDPSSPWYGMTRIRRRDVRIPKDQARLLEDSPCWMPPAPGAPPPHCHVPPALLQQWNDAIIRRFSRSKDVSDQSPPSQIGSPPLPTPDDHDRSQSDSESEASWEPSPPHHLRNPLVPPDSPDDHDRSQSDSESEASLEASPSHHLQNPLVPPDSSPPEIAVRTKPAKDKSRDNPQESHSSSNNGPESGSQAALAADEREELREGEEREEREGGREESNDESDESDMDISMPHPLQSGTQQSETSAAVSSGQSLPSQKLVHEIQVVETPASAFERLRAKRIDGNTVYPKPGHQHSSQSTKFSSESRIMATYGSSAPETSYCPPPEASSAHPERAISHDPAEISSAEPRDSMLNSQMSVDSNSQSQRPELEESQHERSIVRRRTGSPEERPLGGSSGQHPPQGASNSGEQLDHSSPRLPSPDQEHAEKESAENISPRHHPVMDRPENDVDLSSLNQSRDEIRTDEISCSEPPAEPPADFASDIQKDATPRASPVVRADQQNLSVGSNLVKAQRAYEKFCRDYPVYPGDFRHFTRMCVKLEAVRAGGQLRRSFLWDDFIIRHLEDYPRYLEACISAVEEPCRYEDYFVGTFMRPLYKKRSLTAAAVEASAANCAPSRASISGYSTTQSVANHSFTGSLVNQLSRLRTSSFQETADYGTP
ncbi:hypothetical protein DTO280E4_1534 [Paecilomyces variotii]|nr:hypothetical protein DTO207G8_7286 [Paecilomyces variotii]KAJ9265532.1 hypothetical protein DTO195F2_1571 [Paecilomyces variotii]KAJ9364288.1 hypothetical protein DTO280E4_1534 [Paecilomyces variotii]KAJ9374137.1 hypothetical protein DTO282E5_1059 [Paecilomyces variotii]KAJ9392581.1 hypothetical protein DTO063F5_381 [Paecilomyces variotii]